MPCENCGSLLYIEKNTRQFFCPKCGNLEFEDEETIQDKIDQKKELLSKENILDLLKPYSKRQLVLLLAWELNKSAHEFIQTRKTGIREWVYLNTIIGHILQEDGFGGKEFDVGNDLPEELDTVVDAYAALKKHLDLVEQEFQYCAPKPVPSGSKLTLSGEYMIFDTEYHVGYYRCAESLIGASEETVEFFDVSREQIRENEILSLSEIDNSEEFGESYFHPILGFVFMMTSEEHSKKAYTLNAPESVKITEVMRFLDLLNGQFTSSQHAYMIDNPLLTATNPEILDTCGRRAFGKEAWEKFKDEIVVSENNTDAYPLLYELTRTEEVMLEGFRRRKEVPITSIFYPKFYSSLLRFHMYPMLNNGSEKSGKEVLDEMIKETGDHYEINLAKYLEKQGYDCYFQAWISKSNKQEVDVIAVSDSETLFIEAKHFRPPMGLYSKSGMEKLNQKFDYEIFKLDNGYYDETPDGPAFDDILQNWMNSNIETFSFEKLSDGERSTIEFDEGWLDNEVYSFVVSNLTPSYVQKNGVRFLTDIELVKFIEDGEEVFYQLPN